MLDLNSQISECLLQWSSNNVPFAISTFVQDVFSRSGFVKYKIGFVKCRETETWMEDPVSRLRTQLLRTSSKGKLLYPTASLMESPQPSRNYRWEVLESQTKCCFSALVLTMVVVRGCFTLMFERSSLKNMVLQVSMGIS